MEHRTPNMVRFRVTTDLVVFTVGEDDLKVLLVRRKNAPFPGLWALPGGTVEPEESLESAARRELQEETGVRNLYLEQLYTFGDPDRDPRGRTVTVAYYALIRPVSIHPDSGATEAAWHSASRPPRLAFDHARILRCALERLRAKLEYTTVGFQLLPKRFTLPELQHLYEILLHRRLDKRNFRKKILSLGLLRPLGARKPAGAHRPARVYSFVRKRRLTFAQIV